MTRGKISNLPKSISIHKTNFTKGEKSAKFSTGPTPPNPGPTFPTQVITAVKEVVNPKLSTEIIIKLPNIKKT